MEPVELTAWVVLAWQLGGAEQASLLEACTRALSSGRCVYVGEEDVPARPGDVTARVELALDLEVKVRVQGGPTDEASERSMRFLPADTDLERAKAVGLTVGVLAGESARREEPTIVASEPVVEPPFEVEEPQAESWRGLVLSGQVAFGWDEGLRAAEVGIIVRGGWQDEATPWLVGVGVDHWWSHPQALELRIDKTHGFLWVGYRQSIGSWELGGLVDLGMQWLRATTVSPLPNDRAGRGTPVVRLSGTAAYWPRRSWGLKLAAQAAWNASTTELYVHDAPLAHTGRVHLALLLGPVLRWPSAP